MQDLTIDTEFGEKRTVNVPEQAKQIAKNTTNPSVKGSIPKVDFAIAGFPKCSTTFLRNTLLQSHNQSIFYGNDDTEISLLQKNRVRKFAKLFSEPSHSGCKKAFKDPSILYSEVALSNLETYFPSTDFVISIRHPVRWFESFYNYRVRRGHHMPPPNSLIGTCATNERYHSLDPFDQNQTFHAKHICTDWARFHLVMSRLGKTPMQSEQEELKLIHHHNLSIHMFPNRVFLMELGQLSVDNRSRADSFVDELESFLHLSPRSLPRLKRHIQKHNVAQGLNVSKVKQTTFDICSSKYDNLRSVLIEIGREASTWIRSYFVQSPDVFVANRFHFLELLGTWEHDPCITNNDL